MGTLLHTEALAVGHGGRALLRNVHVDAKRGELIAMIGANGTGKSTLLRTLAGLHAPLTGTISIDGHDLATLSANERARQVSIVLTGRPLVGLMDVRTLVALGRQPWTGSLGRMSEGDRVQVRDAMIQLGVIEFGHRSIASLSDGEFQRVMIARAVAQDTPLMLLDEPTAFLDVVHRVQVLQLLRTITRSTQRTVLFSTHDLQQALDLCDRLIILRRDGSSWQGTPGEAVAQGVLADAFESEGLRFDPATRTFEVAP